MTGAGETDDDSCGEYQTARRRRRARGSVEPNGLAEEVALEGAYHLVDYFEETAALSSRKGVTPEPVSHITRSEVAMLEDHPSKRHCGTSFLPWRTASRFASCLGFSAISAHRCRRHAARVAE